MPYLDRQPTAQFLDFKVSGTCRHCNQDFCLETPRDGFCSEECQAEYRRDYQAQQMREHRQRAKMDAGRVFPEAKYRYSDGGQSKASTPERRDANGTCVTRAFANALGISFDDAWDLLAAEVKACRPRKKTPANGMRFTEYGPALKKLGWMEIDRARAMSLGMVYPTTWADACRRFRDAIISGAGHCAAIRGHVLLDFKDNLKRRKINAVFVPPPPLDLQGGMHI